MDMGDAVVAGLVAHIIGGADVGVDAEDAADSQSTCFFHPTHRWQGYGFRNVTPSMPRLSASFGTVRCHLGAPFIGPARNTVSPVFSGRGVGDLMTGFIGRYSIIVLRNKAENNFKGKQKYVFNMGWAKKMEVRFSLHCHILSKIIAIFIAI